MLEQLAEFDVSAIADLVRIKQEEVVLRERLAKMESRKGAVSPLVYQKVRQDYENRQSALDAEARPLKQRARKEYAKLQVLRADVERAMEDVRLQKEELEFRQELGEFRDEQFAEKLAACEQQLADRTAQLEEIGKLRERFVAAFHSEQELEIAEAAGTRAPAAGVSEPGGKRPESPTQKIPRAEQATQPPGSGPPTSSAASDSSPVESADDLTVVSARSNEGGSQTTAEIPKPGGASPPTTLTAVIPTLPPPPPPTPFVPRDGTRPAVPPIPNLPRPAAVPPSMAQATTRALAMPRVLLIVDNQPREEHALKPGITSIGRSPKNIIKLQGSDVSRHHANIVLTPAGYRLIDRGAENGVFVNGQRVDEHLLADGDVIQIGTQKLLYRD